MSEMLSDRLEKKVSQVKNKNGNKIQSVKGMLSDVKIQKRFEELLGEKAQGFISSIINVVNGNTDLQQCLPDTVIGSAVMAAALDLPIEPNLGFAYIVPYNTKLGTVYVKKAQFQVGYKGFTQLAIRTGAYKTISATPIYKGEVVKYNRITSELEMGEAESDEVVGYMAYYKLLNGFEKYLYMTKEEVQRHAQAYSKSYNNKNGIWNTNFDAMATKTVLKRLLSKYGLLSIQMEKALNFDQGVINYAQSDEKGLETFERVEYIDTEFSSHSDELGANEGDIEKNEQGGTYR